MSNASSDKANEMLPYEDLRKLTRQHLDAAKAELAQLDRKRDELIDRIQQLEVMVGIRRATPQKKRGRIKSENLKGDIISILSGAESKTLSAASILEQLVDGRAYPRTRSLRTRVYSSLSKWAGEDDTEIERVDRGLYKLILDEG